MKNNSGDKDGKYLAADLFKQLDRSLYSLVTNQGYLHVGMDGIEDEEVRKYIEHYNKLVSDFEELNHFIDDLTTGNYSSIMPPGKHNYLAAKLKELHSMLSYTMWQAGLIAKGDYRGRVYFEGDFAVMFNRMVQQLEERERLLKKEIDQRRAAEQASIDKHTLLLSILENLNTTVLVVDCEQKTVLYSNKMAREMFLHFGRNVCFQICQVDVVTVNPADSEFCSQYEERWYSVKVNTLLWHENQSALIFLVEDITKTKKEQEELLAKASFDLLTGIYNRTEGMRQLTEKLKSGYSLCVVFIDMDGLKYINDNFGHKEGDQALIALTDIIKKCVREGDVLCRLGGDEFMVIFEQCQPEYAEKVMGRVEAFCNDYNAESDRPYRISFSYGISQTDGGNDKNALELVNRADMMMYINKRNKKARGEIQMRKSLREEDLQVPGSDTGLNPSENRIQGEEQ